MVTICALIFNNILLTTLFFLETAEELYLHKI